MSVARCKADEVPTSMTDLLTGHPGQLTSVVSIGDLRRRKPSLGPSGAISRRSFPYPRHSERRLGAARPSSTTPSSQLLRGPKSRPHVGTQPGQATPLLSAI